MLFNCPRTYFQSLRQFTDRNRRIMPYHFNNSLGTCLGAFLFNRHLIVTLQSRPKLIVSREILASTSRQPRVNSYFRYFPPPFATSMPFLTKSLNSRWAIV